MTEKKLFEPDFGTKTTSSIIKVIGIGGGGGATAGATAGSSSGAGGNGMVIVWEYA